MRIAIFGFGYMGQKIASIFSAKGATVAAVIDPAEDIEQRVLKCFHGAPDRPTCYRQVPNLRELALDVVVHSFATKLSDVRELALVCAAAGIDVVSIAEDAFEPFFDDSDTRIADEIDEAFIRGGCSLLSTGVQDNYLYRIPLALMEGNAGVRRLRIENIADLAILGPAVFDYMPIGKSVSEAMDFVEEGFSGRVCFDVAIRPLVRRIGRSIVKVKNELKPIVASSALSIPQHGLEIETGSVCGIEEHTVVVLEDGGILDLSLIFKFSSPGSPVYFRYELSGESDTKVNIEPFDGAMATCAAVVSRAYTMPEAPPGFLSVDQLR